MSRKGSQLTLDAAVLESLRKRGINVSEEVREFLRILDEHHDAGDEQILKELVKVKAKLDAAVMILKRRGGEACH